MTRHGSLNSSTVHPSGGSAADSPAPRCCARCRRGTPATGIGPCGYGDAGCPNEKCGCHKPLPESVHTVYLTVDGHPFGMMSREEYEYSAARADLIQGTLAHDLALSAARVKEVFESSSPIALRETGTP